MKPVIQTAQFAALKRVLWFMERRKPDYSDPEDFPFHSYSILKSYVEDQEKQAHIAFMKEKIISEQGIPSQVLHASNVPVGHTGE